MFNSSTSSRFILGTMADNQDLFNLIDNFLKILFILAFGMYVIFSFIATRQIHIMKNTLQTKYSIIVQIFGYIHLALAILVLIVFLLS